MIKEKLNVSLVKPSNGGEGVSLDTPISVSFTKDLNKGTILKNFLVIKDLGKDIKDIDDIKNKPYEVVTGSIEYKNKEIIFTPSKDLDFDSRYLIIVRRHLQNIMNDSLLRDSMFSFNTVRKFDTNIASPIPKITYPKNMSIIEKLQTLEWESSSTTGFVVQVATTETFNEISFKYETLNDEKSCIIDRELSDGNYYIRVKSFDSKWSEISQVYLQNPSLGPVSESDNFVNDIDDLLHELNLKAEFTHEVDLHGSGKRYPLGNNRFLFTINDIVSPKEFDVSLTRTKDIVNDEDIAQDVTILSKTFSYDYQNSKTYVVVEIDG